MMLTLNSDHISTLYSANTISQITSIQQSPDCAPQHTNPNKSSKQVINQSNHDNHSLSFQLTELIDFVFQLFPVNSHNGNVLGGAAPIPDKHSRSRKLHGLEFHYKGN